MEKMREKELALDLLADVAGGFVQAALSTISISRREEPAVWRSC